MPFRARLGGEAMELLVLTLVTVHLIYDGGVSHYVRLNVIRPTLGRALLISGIGAIDKGMKNIRLVSDGSPRLC